MCGLAAIFSYHSSAPPVDQAELLRIREAMHTRGPDGEGVWISGDKRIGLAHRRLAIIDLSDAGAQPMATPDGTVRIVFNGEIYNYRELRLSLEAKGYRFRSHSDTEVLLYLYQEHGQDFAHHLRGMYAIAIWDERKRGLLLVRDPFGIKPLYYADDGNTIRVASQVKALLKGDAVDTTPEPAGHVGFFLWGHVPEPYTLYKSIRALPAGTTLWVDAAGQKQIWQFFSITEELAKTSATRLVLSGEQMHEHLRTALLDSVRHHLIADVPVGIFLSAGLDSSTLLALAKEVGVTDLNTVTLGFSEFQGTQNDETPLAEMLAQHYGSHHQTRWVAKEDFHGEYQRLLAAMDQPSIDGVNSYFISKAAKEAGLKVALSGVGGDELFAGYSYFQHIPRMVGLLRPVSRIPWLGAGFRYVTAPLLKCFTSPKYAGVLEYGGDYAGAYLLRRGFYMPWELPEVLDADLVRQGWGELQTLAHLQQTTRGIENSQHKITALETAWYMRNQLLRDTDWASMAHSLEIRTPLVDIELFRMVTRLSHAGNLPAKQDMANTPATPLPAFVLNRPKTGFSIPVQYWLMGLPENAGTQAQRGLRGWAAAIYNAHGFARHGDGDMKVRHSAQHTTMTKPISSAGQSLSCIGLLAPEVCTRGGIQSFMLRVAEVMGELVNDNEAAKAYCISLNDSTEALRQYSVMPEVVDVWGANRSKSKLIAYAFMEWPLTDGLFVGHVGQAPVAYVLKVLGRVRKYYVILHGIEAWGRVSFLKRLALLGADGIIATTRFTAEECARHNHILADRFQIIPLCADERKVLPSPGFRLKGEFKLLCVARQDASERYKGLEQIFQALALLKLSHPGIHLNLVGNGDDQPRLKGIVDQLGVRPQVTFWGELSDEDLAAAYQDCDIFVMPSKQEGFGIVFLEAMRRGKPCIGGNHGGTPDVIEHGKSGYLVEYGDEVGLAQQILSLFSDTSLRLAMGERGQMLTAGKFSFYSFRSDYEQMAMQGDK